MSFWSLAISSSLKLSDRKSNAAAIVSATESAKNVAIRCDSADLLADDLDWVGR
jgi:hypothetical protein